MSRISRDELFMEIAALMAQRGTCDRAKVGAIIVAPNYRIISSGYNGALEGQSHCDEVGHLLVDGSCIRAIHAEQNAIVMAARFGFGSTNQACIYTTHFPCPTCAKMIVAAGITRLVYYNGYRPDLDLASRHLMLGVSIIEMKD